MSTVAQVIIDAAYGRSAATRPELASTGAPELLRVLNKALLSRFQLAAHRAPPVFGGSAEVAFSSDPGGWRIPLDALVIVGIQGLDSTDPVTLDGQWVRMVRFDDRAQQAGEPSVFLYGRYLFPSGNGDDPVGGDLSVGYARAPAILTSLQQEIDAEWPDAFNALLELPVAIYLARKDARTEDIAVFVAEEQEWLALYDAWLGGQTLIETSRFREFRALDLKPAR